MSGFVNRLVGGNVYINGANFLGQAEEVMLPEIKYVMSEHKVLGMVGTPEFWDGIEKLEAKIKWSNFYPDAFKIVANPFATVQLQVRSNLETYTAQGRVLEVPVVTVMRCTFKSNPLGQLKPQAKSEGFESELSVYSLKQTSAGLDVIEIDVLANIFKVGGVDLRLGYNLNVGV